MGYCSDVRMLIEKRNFKKLCEEAKAKFPEGSLLDHLDIKQEWTGKDEKDKAVKYVYFGWDCIKFYYEQAEWIEEFIQNLKEFHYVRIGENWDDLDEHYHLNKTDVDCISIIRCFDEPVKQPESVNGRLYGLVADMLRLIKDDNNDELWESVNRLKNLIPEVDFRSLLHKHNLMQEYDNRPNDSVKSPLSLKNSKQGKG